MYGATFLVEPDSANDELIETAIDTVAKEKWPEKSKATLAKVRGNPQKCCYYSGDLKEYDGFAGMMALSAKRNQDAGHPKIVDRNPNNELSSADGKPYGGSYVNAKVDIWAQDNKWGQGIRATLAAVQFVKDGDAFTASGPATSEGFEEEAGSDDDLI